MTDVLVLGAGLVGLCAARACALRGLRVTLVSGRRAGEASSAAGGILSSRIEGATPEVNDFAAAARDAYPALIQELEERTGVPVAFNRLGILEVARDEGAAEHLAAEADARSEWLDAAQLAALEPELAPVPGALLHVGDGAVDNVSLLSALWSDITREERIAVVHARALRLRMSADAMHVETRRGRVLSAERVVLAMGAWSAQLEGLPRPLPVAPLRGQVVTLGGTPLRHVCYGAGHYMVPRWGAHTLVGSTMDYAGFVPGTSEAAIAGLLDSARRTAPALRLARELARWSGLRPATPDLLPIIGPDPEEPRLLYACGHSRNGVLMAPMTGGLLGALVAGGPPAGALEPFAITRFDTA